MIALFVVTARADPPPPAVVLTVGDGLVAAPAVPGASAPTVPGGWVPILADCLEERAPHGFTVVDRVTPAETISSARGRAAEWRELGPAVVVVALGARELGSGATAASLRGPVRGLVADLRAEGRRILLVPPVPADGASPQVVAYDEVLAGIGRSDGAVDHVDLLTGWPKPTDGGAALVRDGGLSDEGHARVAAVVCDAVLGGR